MTYPVSRNLRSGNPGRQLLGIAASRRICRTDRRGQRAAAEVRRRLLPRADVEDHRGRSRGPPALAADHVLHSSEQAQTIGRKTLKDLCVALDVNEQVERCRGFPFQAGAHPGRDREGQARTLSRQEQG